MPSSQPASDREGGATPSRSGRPYDVAASLTRANDIAVVATFRDAFPGTTMGIDAIEDGALRETRQQMFSDYCDLLWHDLEGYACLFVGAGGHFLSNHYRFANTSQRFFAWPAQAKELAAAVTEAAPTKDVYLAPMLRSTDSRKKGSGAGSRYLWADCDGPWTEQRSEALAPMMNGRSFVIGSGSGKHVYVGLDDVAPVEMVERLNRRLALVLGGDHKWDETALLRPPGTFNHKGYAKGTGSTLVRWCLP